MKASWAAVGAFLSLVHQSAANLDIITLPANGNTWIQEAEATLILGDVPKEITGDAALWSAIMMDQQDFLQGVTQNSPGRYDWDIGRESESRALMIVQYMVSELGQELVQLCLHFEGLICHQRHAC